MKPLFSFLLFFALFCSLNCHPSLSQEIKTEDLAPKAKMVTLDFNNVDLPVLVKFFSELTGKNFVIDEKVKGKVTVFSPTKMTISKAYEVFLNVLDLKGFTTVQSGEIIQILPTSEVPVGRTVHVYSLANAGAEDITKTLTSFLSRPTTVVQHPRIRGEGDFEGQVQVFPDKASNTLVVYASERDYEMLKGIIQKFDQVKKQVFVEAVILEVSVSKLRNLGVELANLNPNAGVVGAINFGNIGNFALTGPSAIAGSSGLILGAGTGVVPSPFSTAGTTASGSILNINALLTALQADSDVNVLSTPQILATNFQKARIVVGQNVPFPVGSTTTPGGVIQQNIDRKDVGVSLELTPEVLENKRVKLDIRQEISSVVATAQGVSQNLGPTTNKREATTSVIVDDQQTIVIGGLIQDNYSKTENKVPFLGDIPILGWLFRYQTKTLDKDNLMIFLTPHIMKDQEQFTKLENEKIGDMDRFIEKNKMEKKEKSPQEIVNGQNIPPKPQ